MSKTLTVYLAADTNRFRREMRQADDAIDGFGNRAGGLGSTLKNVVGPAMIGVGAAAGAMAIAVGVDAVKAFVDDERAAAGLAQTLRNLGLGQATASVEQFIDAQQRLTGVTDEKLRPSMDRLLRSTKNVADAQDLLTLALDVSAGSGKDLETVTAALAKAADGNTQALGRLGVGLDKATLKTKTFDEITAAMAKTFTGQAATAANTLSGKLDKVTVAFDELKESFGRGFVKGVEEASGSTDQLAGDMQNLEGSAGSLGTFLGQTAILGLRQFAAAFYQMSAAIDAVKVGDFAGAWQILASETAPFLNDFSTKTLGGGDGLISATNAAAAAFEDARRTMTLFREETKDSKKEQENYGGAVRETNSALEAQAARTGDLTGQLEAAAGKVNEYAKQISDFRTALTGQIMSGVDLGAAFEQQGTQGGVSLIDAFLAQLANAENFADVLQRMDQGGASQALIDMVASKGPEIGTKLGQQLLDEGLIPTINEKFEATRNKIYETTSTLIPDFLLLGQQSALATMDGLEDKIEKNEKRLRKMGQDIGEPIGAEIKAKIAAAVDAAIKAAQAAAAAAPISIGGQTSPGTGQPATTTAPAATNRATTVLLNNVLTQSNYRGGNVTGGTLVFS